MPTEQEQADAILAAMQGGATPAAEVADAARPADTETSGANKRVDRRAPARYPFTLIMKNAEGREGKLSGYTDDVSVGGVSVVVSGTDIPLQTVLAVRFELHLNGRIDTIVATARCVHKAFVGRLGGFKYGLQFLKITPEYKGVIERYVRVKGG